MKISLYIWWMASTAHRVISYFFLWYTATAEFMKTPFTWSDACVHWGYKSRFDSALSQHRKGKFLKQSCVSTRPAPCKIVEHMQNTFLLHSRRRRAGNQPARIIICCYALKCTLYTICIYLFKSLGRCVRDAIQTRQKGHFFSSRTCSEARERKFLEGFCAGGPIQFSRLRIHLIQKSTRKPFVSDGEKNGCARSLKKGSEATGPWCRSLFLMKQNTWGREKAWSVSQIMRSLQLRESTAAWSNNLRPLGTAQLDLHEFFTAVYYMMQKKATSYNLVSTGKWVFALKLPCRWSKFLNK